MGRSVRLPVVLTQAEVGALLKTMEGPNGLVAHLLYGAGLRLSEALRLRVKDLDFEYERITVRQDKGKKDRRTMLPGSLEDPLRRQLRKSKAVDTRNQEPPFPSDPQSSTLACRLSPFAPRKNPAKRPSFLSTPRPLP